MMTDELELRLARLAGNLVRDLDEVDMLTFGKGREQKVQLAREAFDEALTYARTAKSPERCRCGEYETCEVCIEQHRQFRAARQPDSLTDHGA